MDLYGNNKHIILTNGRDNPNENLGASGENYYEMQDRIESLGSIKEILKEHDLVKSIIAYNGDRHFFTAFIALVNKSLAKNEITTDDLEVFTSGEVADAIVNIEKTAREYGNREAYPCETLDKLNYLALIKDGNAYAASFTHPKILKAMAGDMVEGINYSSRELREWSRSSHTPQVDGFATVVSELLESKDINDTKGYLEFMGFYPLKYATDQKENGFSLLNNNGKGQVLTNGRTNPNERQGASGENYYEMQDRIESLGSIKEILQNHDLVKSIIAYNGDRHFFAAFIDLVNKGLTKKEITTDDLEVFTSGEVADAIVNIEKTAKVYGNREAYPGEKGDKLNYLSLIKDSNAYAASFTHPEILKAMSKTGDIELREWSIYSTKAPVNGYAAVIYKIVETGNIKQAKKMVDRIGFYTKKYSQAHRQEEKQDELSEMLDDENNYSDYKGDEPNIYY